MLEIAHSRTFEQKISLSIIDESAIDEISDNNHPNQPIEPVTKSLKTKFKGVLML